MKELENFDSLTPTEQAYLFLMIFRESTDASGRVVCSPNFKTWLMEQAAKKGYQISTYYSSFSYSPPYARLKHLKYVVKLNRKPHAGLPVILRVDITTPVESVRHLPLGGSISLVITDEDTEFVLQVMKQHLSPKDQAKIITEQTAEIARLNNLVEALQNTHKTVKRPKNRSKQA